MIKLIFIQYERCIFEIYFSALRTGYTIVSCLGRKFIEKWPKTDLQETGKRPIKERREYEVACSYIGRHGRWRSDLRYTQGEFLKICIPITHRLLIINISDDWIASERLNTKPVNQTWHLNSALLKFQGQTNLSTSSEFILLSFMEKWVTEKVPHKVPGQTLAKNDQKSPKEKSFWL